MHSGFYIHWRAPRRLAARIALFSFLAIAVAAPSHAGKARVDYGAAPVVAGLRRPWSRSARHTRSAPRPRILKAEPCDSESANLPGLAELRRSTGTLSGHTGPAQGRDLPQYPDSSDRWEELGRPARVCDHRSWRRVRRRAWRRARLQPPVAGPVNTPPTISGTPPTSAAVGQPYTFRPAATDAGR